MSSRSLRTLLSVLALWLSAPWLPAGADQWTSIGPDGGSVTALAVDPVGLEVLFAGTERGGIFKSVDRGVSWRPVNAGLSAQQPLGRVAVLALDPVHPSTVYASISGGGVFQSVNGGATWTPLLLNPSFPDPGIGAIAVSPAAPDIVYAGGYVSRDSGETWTRGIVTQFFFQSVAVDPKAAGVAYLATPAQGLFRTSDAGASWVPVAGSPPGIGALAVDPFEPTNLYAGTAAGRIYRSADRGQTWTLTFVLADSPNVTQIVPDPNVRGRLYATSAAGFFRSDDSGSTWSMISGLSGLAPLVFAPDPLSTAILYAGTGAGALRSTDGGASWGLANKGIAAFPISALATDPRLPSTIWAGVEGSPAAVARSDSAGGSWTFHPLPGATGVVSVATDAGNSDIVYAASRNAVFRSEDGGLSWSTSNGVPAPPVPLYSWSIRAFAADPRNPGTVYAGWGGGRGNMGSVSVSRDGGRTWRDSYPAVPLGSVQALTVDPASPGTLWVSSITGTWRSPDAGTTWAQTGPWPGFFTSFFAVDPANPTTLYGSGTGIQETGIWKSTDAGATWSRLASGRNDGGGPIVSDPSSNTLFIGGVGTVSKTSDGGATWIELARGLEPHPVKAIALGANATTVYSAPESRSVFAYSISRSGSQCVADATTLCLHGARFEVRVAFHSNDGLMGDGRAVPAASADTGSFWFFSGRNLELLVKVVDGRAVNGSFWVFSGALSDVAYTLTVRDAETGAIRSYDNPQGRVASIADTSAFPATGEPIDVEVPPSGYGPGTKGPSPCGDALCLWGGRFRIQARSASLRGPSGPAAAYPLTRDAGALWFFSPNNLELLVKVVDGRPVNGKFWVFVGALSNVEYTVVVTDMLTGKIRSYENPAGTLASFADTESFE